MLRLKANVGIKWVYWKDRCPNFSSYICGCRSSEDQKKTLDETRRKLRTDLPTSQSQVITVIIYINCILDLLSKMSSSSHHYCRPCPVSTTSPRLCWGDRGQFQLAALPNLRKVYTGTSSERGLACNPSPVRATASGPNLARCTSPPHLSTGRASSTNYLNIDT